MKKRKIITILILIFALFFVFFINLSTEIFGEQEEDLKQISVIVNDSTNEHWATVKRGMDQAAAEYRVEISFVLLAKNSDGVEQSYLMEREEKNEAQALIIVPEDSQEVRDMVNKVSVSIPIIGIKNQLGGDTKIPSVFADYYAMGYDLGMVMKEEKQTKNILILSSGLDELSRSTSLEGIKKGIGKDVCLKELNLSSFAEGTKDLKSKIMVENIGTIIALEASSLEIAAKTIEHYKLNTNLYGMGSTSSIVNYLENGTIDTIIAQNEFSIGYLGIQAAVNAIKRQKVKTDATIQYSVINKENMYTEEHQKILFPLIQ